MLLLHSSSIAQAALQTVTQISGASALAPGGVPQSACEWATKSLCSPQDEFEEQWKAARRLLLQLKPKHAAATLAHLLLKGQHPLQQLEVRQWLWRPWQQVSLIGSSPLHR